MVEDIYRVAGIEPVLAPVGGGSAVHPPPAAAAAAAAGSSNAFQARGRRARLPEPAVGMEAMIGRLTTRGESPAVTAARAGTSGARGKSVKGGGVGGVGGGNRDTGAWGNEVRDLLKRAGCERHVEQFRAQQVDMEAIHLMRDVDFTKMGVTEVRSVRRWYDVDA